MHRRRRLCDLNMARDLLNTSFRALDGAFARETGALKHCNYPHRASPTRRMAEKPVMEGQEGQGGGLFCFIYNWRRVFVLPTAGGSCGFL